MKKLLASLVLCAICGYSFAQSENVDKDQYDENYEFSETREINVSAGVGIGLDYGGIGARLTFAPVKYVALFGALGYNLNGAGYNGGAVIRILPESMVCPFISAMYGYNAVIIIDGWKEKNKTYYGYSVGTGIELRRPSGNYWNFEMLIPARSKEFKDDYDELDRNPDVEMPDALPIQVSVGYHFKL